MVVSKVFIACGGYYDNFNYPKALTEINGEKLVDRTIRLLKEYGIEPTVCCNLGETLFDSYNPTKCKFTYNHVQGTGYYLDLFDALPIFGQCIILYGDVYYTEQAIDKIILKYEKTDRNIFICNALPFNEKRERWGEPFGWIVKDEEEFAYAVSLGKKFQDRGIVVNRRTGKLGGVPTNWELAQIINGLDVNGFYFDEEDCLIISDKTIDVDDPSAIERVSERVK